MDYNQAYLEIVKASIQKNTIEVPTFLSMLDFENLTLLDANPKFGARIALKLAGFAKHITCLEKDPEIAYSIEQEITKQGLQNKISLMKYTGWKQERFPLADNAVDLAYYAWGSHNTYLAPKFLNEMIRVSKKHILFILAGAKGDEPKFASIVNREESKRRQEYLNQLSKYLKSKDYKLAYKSGILKLDFSDFATARETLCTLNSISYQDLTKQKRAKLEKFLKPKIHNFQDGFYVLHAEKIYYPTSKSST